MRRSDRNQAEQILAQGKTRILEMLQREPKREQLIGRLEALVEAESRAHEPDLQEFEVHIAAFREQRAESFGVRIFIVKPAADEPRFAGLLRVFLYDEGVIADALLTECCEGKRSWEGILEDRELARLEELSENL